MSSPIWAPDRLIGVDLAARSIAAQFPELRDVASLDVLARRTVERAGGAVRG